MLTRCFVVGLILLAAPGAVLAQTMDKAQPQWIWTEAPSAGQTAFFRKEFELTQRVTGAKLYATCDNQMTIFINGKEILSSDSWETPSFREVTDAIRSPGKGAGPQTNVIAVKARNADGAAGLVLRLVLEGPKKGATLVLTDADWRVAPTEQKGWTEPGFDDSKWARATVVAPLGGGPWKGITAAALSGAAKFKIPTATPIELIKARKDFNVELLYTVPRESQGSWVSLCVDDKGRLIASDQYGKLYRITVGPKATDTRVEQLPVDLGEAQGLLWHSGTLYVVVNRGKKYESGLWRVTSSRKDDTLDTKELLRPLQGGGEHGPHAVILAPDRKSLYVVAGNHTKLTKLSSTTVPQVWGEDFLVPRLWDASGHAVGIMAPGGCIYETDFDGKEWKLISMGYRNQYDIAFNRAGDLFTFDSDMEWDMNLPWYRPTRVCHAAPGSEFGWRGGTGKMYEYHPDNLPPVVNIGPGSPTGICFGYGAKFPAKYQDALFICDWSYGKLYAVHLTPDGASYKGEAEEFMYGSPLPLTDIVVNPADGAMYFTIGGRNALSGLYRVTYVGSEDTKPSTAEEKKGAEARGVRRRLESYYGKKDAAAIDAAWPYLASEDRFLRWAARTVLEFQDPSTWEEKALAEKNPVALTNAMIGLARVSKKDANLAGLMLKALDGIDWGKLSDPQRIDLLRAYQLVFVRLGEPDDRTRGITTGRLNALYPAATREINAELAKLICHLQPPEGVAKTLALIDTAPTQEEQIEYALALRTVKNGWDLKQRQHYFDWFHKASAYRGGNSFHGFLRNIRADAIKSLSAEERDALKEAIAKVPVPTMPKFDTKARPLVKKWSVDELVPVVEKGLTGRNFDKGRNLFGEARCFACHRFSAEGGGTGPDLTGVSGRFGPRDLLESLLVPSKTISDQYQAINIFTTDDRIITGRIVNLAGDGISVNTDMLDPNKLVNVNRKLIASIEPSKVSMMPDGLLDHFTQEEILDLIAYLYSRGERGHAMFRKRE